MNNYIEKIISKIKLFLNISEDDAMKILAGIAILGIAISWFALGDLVTGKNAKISDIEIKIQNEANALAEQASRDFKNK